MNFLYYTKSFGFNALPVFFFKWNYHRLINYGRECDQQELQYRLNYYFKQNKNFEIPEAAQAIKNFKKTNSTTYFLDLKEFLHYFTADTRFAYQFGDETHINPYPTLFKARPITGDNANSVLFKLNKRRHFKWVNDPYSYGEKKDILVWRGGAYHELRRSFVEKFWNHPLCNVGQTNKPKENVPWQKDFLSIKAQLQYKFIFCPEGNDVATNLKWVMSSNSLCLMPKPKFETWFMEGTLKPNEHYVEIKNDYSDLEDKIIYYSRHHEEANRIIKNANNYTNRFKNKNMEDLLCLKVLEKYAFQSGQINALKFSN
ncbi:glycosyl transferase family 90 [Flexithrix dorotheae]|uniref:glycosyl transferase family 90 n=1 Tax=Flexithrix dorotheae TaxID=70993 RepID=UPI00036A2175|nr:glycosyl transferase family 90 [Flexithrix dorotheae]